MSKEMDEQRKKLAQVIKKAWTDEAFMAKLLEDATTVLAEEGIELPEGMKVKALKITKELSYLVIPPKPTGAITDGDLDRVVGTGGAMTIEKLIKSDANKIMGPWY